MRSLCCAVLLCAASASFAQTVSRVVIRCAEDCSVKLGEASSAVAGARLGPREWEFTDVAPGTLRIDVLGVLDRPLYSGTVEVKPNTDAEWEADFKKLTPGRVKVLVEPPDAGPPPPPRPGVLHVRCDTACAVYVDGLKKTPEGKQHDWKDVPPGRHVISAKDRMNTTAEIQIDLAAGTEAFFLSKGKDIRLTNTKPLP